MPCISKGTSVTCIEQLILRGSWVGQGRSLAEGKRMMQAYGVGNGMKMVSGVALCCLVDKVEWQLPVADTYCGAW